MSAKKTNPQNDSEQEPKKKETKLEFTASMAAVLIVGLFIITFNLQAFEIPSSSMENTLLVGDHVFVDRVTFAPPTHWMPFVHYREIHRGDIMVFLSPVQPGLYVVKRVIGLPGDRIHLINGVLYRNGQKVNEPYINYEGQLPDPYAENFPAISPMDTRVQIDPAWQISEQSYVQGGDIVVPEGRYFAMGDHRNVSWDSRYFGFIPRENVVGRPMFIYWSFPTPNDLYQQSSGVKMHFLFFHEILHFFDQTQWRRTLRRVQ